MDVKTYDNVQFITDIKFEGDPCSWDSSQICGRSLVLIHERNGGRLKREGGRVEKHF